MTSFTTTMLLKNLIKRFPQNLKNLKIRGLALNSKDVKRGYIFFAIKGSKSNGEKYINQAIKKGASLIICSKNCNFKSKKINLIKTNNVKNCLIEATSNFYKFKPKNIIAVTGTNGKTSVAEFFCQILEYNGVPVASIGTLGIKHKMKIIKTDLTSPDIITIHKNLALLKRKKIDNVIIEASSHGLAQKRLDGLKFRGGIFTNFSQDHLDYHKTMKAYLASKLILFSKLLKRKSYIISDKSINQYSTLKKISKRKGLRFLEITKKKDEIKNINFSLVGQFQLKNLSMAALAAEELGLKKFEINKAIKFIKNVNGRLELVKKYPNNVRVFIDYAHTPEALREVITSVKENFNDNISLVFGCGGERDFKKRPLMAKIAKSLCKKIYVTDDNPRNENPAKIRKEIIYHLKGSKYYENGNRSRAIKSAILNAEPNESVIVTGKGHETVQNYGNKILNISDKKIIKSIKIKKKTINQKIQNYYYNSKILNKILNNKKFYRVNGVAIDSRNVIKDNIFLAIKGKKNDGINFISKAIKKGATYVVSRVINKKYKNKTIRFTNPLKFLKKFAEFKRKNCDAKILGITGSAGKTSLKNLLGTILCKYYRTYVSPKSFNNHFGVPLSLSNLNFDHKYGVFEIGMSKSGEIGKLSKLIKPDLAVITNIAEAHIENFSNIKGIANAKSEIIKNVKNNGSIVLNRDDKFFNFLSKKAKLKKLKVISFGKSRNSDVRLIKIKNQKNTQIINVKVYDLILDFEIKNINIYNVLASLAILYELKLDINKIIHLFKNFKPSEGRGKIYEAVRYKRKFNLIDESYNANPLSVKNAIINLSAIKKNKFKKYLILGDMLELGSRSEFYHKELSKLINSSDIDKVFVKGEKSLYTYKYLKKEKRGNIFQSDQDIDLILKNIIANNDYLMIKGSNATGLYAIARSIIKGI